MRTKAVKSALVWWRRPRPALSIVWTNLGRSAEPFSGRHSRATPSLPAIDVNVPHSWTTRESGIEVFAVDVLRSLSANANTATATTNKTIKSRITFRMLTPSILSNFLVSELG